MNITFGKEMNVETEMEGYFDRLFPICRSITGRGYQQSLDIIREIIPLEKIDFSSSTECFDWTVPDEWNIQDAYIITPDGKKIARFSDSNLHVYGYSMPVNKEVSLEGLKQHLHTMKEMPDAIPYVTSYYKRNWGFCLPYNEYKNLKEGRYQVFIDSDLKPGKLTIGMTTISGTTDREILLSTYLCHPSMAVNELSGPLVTAFLYKKLIKEKPCRHTIRFVFCPENIGSIAFLSKFGLELKEKIAAGYVINCVGHGEFYTYKRSRQGNSMADRAASNVLKHQHLPSEFIEYFPGGSDERQYCSPGFDLPMGLIMRTMYGKYDEYHTSLDNKELISFRAMQECVDTYFEAIKTIDENRTYKSTVQYGTPQLSKSPIPLYPEIMKSSKSNRRSDEVNRLLELINLSDGNHDLLTIAEKRNFKMLDLIPIKDRLIDAGYLEEIGNQD
jgi:aminopeptidase-like protein